MIYHKLSDVVVPRCHVGIVEAKNNKNISLVKKK